MKVRRQAGFTLIEIMVSIGIFVVAALVMLGTLVTASEIFRRGESARQAGDEATAVLAALRDDLARAVPVRLRDGKPAPEWGRFFADVQGAAGSCRLAFVIENPDRTAIGQDGSGARLWVGWFVNESDPDPSKHELRRVTTAWTPASAYPTMAGSAGEVVTRGCLHFGVWLELAAAGFHRPVTAVDDSPRVDWEVQPPDQGDPYDSQTVVIAADALRLSLVLTGGGRYAVRGTLAQAIADGSSTSFRLAGVKALPTVEGSMLRVDSEWIRYDRFAGGLVSLDAAAGRRGVLRSAPIGHALRSPVLAGQSFSLVVALPR